MQESGRLNRGEVDEAHVKRGALLSHQLMKSSNHEDHINRRPLRSEAALLLWEDTFPFAVIAQAIGYYLEENLASVCHERDAMILTTLRPVPILVQHYDRGIFPILRYAPPTVIAITMALNCPSMRRLS